MHTGTYHSGEDRPVPPGWADGMGEIKDTVLCVARGRGNEWEAFCLDLDLAVQGQSFDEVRVLLREAITTYVEDAEAEDQATQRRLLNRRAPLYVRLLWAWRFFRAALSGRGTSRDSSAWFPMPCHA